MSYTRNFGMRSFENVVRNGRFRTPAGSSFEIGAPVVVDPDKPGLMKAAAAGDKPNPSAGLVVFEHIQRKGVDLALATAEDFHTVPGGQYAQIMRGPGAKVWFKNTDDRLLADGRGLPGGKLLADSVDTTTLKAGAGLVPDGNGKFKVAGNGDTAWLTVEQVNPSSGRVEARFNF